MGTSTQIYSYLSNVVDNLTMHLTSKALSVLRERKPLSMKCNTSPTYSNTVNFVHEKVDQNCVACSLNFPTSIQSLRHARVMFIIPQHNNNNKAVI